VSPTKDLRARMLLGPVGALERSLLFLLLFAAPLTYCVGVVIRRM
jgi:hypothetical protein